MRVMEKYKILVVDDEKEIRDAVEIYLRGENHIILKAEDGIEALEVFNVEKPHLVILDIMMPKLDGMRTCLKIREKSNVPIIMLSAKGEDSDKVLGLNLGADDYVTKPFNHLELVARVKSQLRRYDNPIIAKQREKEIEGEILVIRDLVINKETKSITVRGKEIKVTATEYKILLLLASNPGRIFSIQEIYERVWDEPFYNSENTVTVHVRRIREKIEINPKEPEYLKVVWGIGYKIQK
jgi:DNA-binding response OmpR family regulator